MYAVIDLHQVPVVKTRAEGELFLHNLRHYNTQAKWHLFVGITEAPLDELERLYALAAMLLEASGANPLGIQMELPQLDGSVQTITAVSIMHSARSWLDQVQEAN
jgi:hypothetical protein